MVVETLADRAGTEEVIVGPEEGRKEQEAVGTAEEVKAEVAASEATPPVLQGGKKVGAMETVAMGKGVKEVAAVARAAEVVVTVEAGMVREVVVTVTVAAATETAVWAMATVEAEMEVVDTVEVTMVAEMEEVAMATAVKAEGAASEASPPVQ